VFLAVEGDLQRTVGRNLRAYREAKGLSQEAFADVLGVHRTYMGGILGVRISELATRAEVADQEPT
jgi:transcriptional regulator with XRE-family HTH domain